MLQFDAVMDLAILKIDADHPLPAIKIGTSSDLMVGETVITIGNAFGYENTVSVGIVSALHRDVTLSDEQVYRNLIQTDACINPGNSGGPLINIDGELIGINVAVRAGAQGIGFALPIDEVKLVATEMISTRRLASTWHGLVAGEQRSGARRRVVVSEVQPGSPAEAAGLQSRATSWSGWAIWPSRARLDLERGMLDVRPGQPAPGGDPPRQDREHACPSTSASSPGATAAAPVDPDDVVWRLLGIKTQPVSPDYVASVSPKLRGGLYIQSVLPGQPRGPGGHPEGRHPGGHERRDPALGDDPGRQHPLRASPARDDPRRTAPALRRPAQRNSAAPDQLRRFGPALESGPMTPHVWAAVVRQMPAAWLTAMRPGAASQQRTASTEVDRSR